MTNRPDLIAQLEKLSPTEGEEKWQDSYGIIDNGEVVLFDRIEATTDDCTLVALAPTMRLEILAMDELTKSLYKEIEDKDKRIEKLKKDVLRLKRINSLND